MFEYFAAKIDVDSLPNPGGNPIQTILQIVFAVLGAVAVLFFVIGSFRLVWSRGEPQQIARARDTMLYSLIGIVVTVSAYTIVTFVIDRL